MLNVGPKPDCTIPEQAALALRNSGNWIKNIRKHCMLRKPLHGSLLYYGVMGKGKQNFVISL